MEFYIYDDSSYRVGVLQGFRSMQWQKVYDETGEFQLVTKSTLENRALLKEHFRILKTDDETIGFIESIYDDGDILEVRGYLDILDDRICMNISLIQNVEQDVYTLIENNGRGLDISFAPYQSLEETVAVMPSYSSLRSIVSTVCKECGLGFRMMKFNTCLNVFQIYKGHRNYDVIFSENFGNIFMQSYLKDVSNFRNFAIVVGEEAHGEVPIIYVDETHGAYKKEIYVDAKDIKHVYKDEQGNTMLYSDEEYTQLLMQRGLEILAEHLEKHDYTVEIDENDESFRYGKDYQLGDIVRIKSIAYGITAWFRIHKVKDVFERKHSILLTLKAVDLLQMKKED